MGFSPATLSLLEDGHLGLEGLVEGRAIAVHPVEGGQVEADGLVLVRREVEELVDVVLVRIAGHVADDARVVGDARHGELAHVLLSSPGLELDEDAVSRAHAKALCYGLRYDDALAVGHALEPALLEDEALGQEGLAREVHAGDGKAGAASLVAEGRLEAGALGDVPGGDARRHGRVHDLLVVADYGVLAA